jgi:hypothetical protein
MENHGVLKLNIIYVACVDVKAANCDADLAATFSVLGHVLHLIQEMAVPAQKLNA